MYILGLNAYHGDAAAALFRDGELVVATEEERIRRVKHWAGLPVEAVKFCLQEAGIGAEELSAITVSRDPMAKMGHKLWYLAKRGLLGKQLGSRIQNSFSIRKIKGDLAVELGLDPASWKAEVQYIEHHRSHLASAFMVSPFETAALLSVDGMGDFTSTMRAIGKGNRIQVLDSVSYPHSLGILYTAFTQYLGFRHYGDEYKVMGLASYGRPVYLDQLRECVQLLPNGLFRLNPLFFSHFRKGVAMSWEGGTPALAPLYDDMLEKRFGPARTPGLPVEDFHRDMAASVQALCEEVIFYMAADLHRKTGLPNLCLAGGVAQNSVANGKLTSRTPFERLYIPPAAHDAGTAAGSVLYWWHHNKGFPRQGVKASAYTGAQFSDAEIIAAAEAAGCDYRLCGTDELIALAADKLASGAVVGWFQGRAEFGPRALGNRSILADPRRADAQHLLNEKIKRRESFRPFAPSILAEAVGDYFEQTDEVPFMEKVFSIRPEKRHLIPAVTHVDGTGRLQTVHEADNPRYYQLIRRFFDLTGIPILLNTSFNENEPIVNSPEHALACYLRTQMDVLVMGNVLLSR
ncbi:MAG: carbamoyltransferase [Saprospiraceae bacterium]|nr:carbamoyltransferase [Saprospiraceae bacterium]